MGKPKALRRLMKGAKMGRTPEMYALGLRYEVGRGVEKDLVAAIFWIRLAALGGFPPAVIWMQDQAFADGPLADAQA